MEIVQIRTKKAGLDEGRASWARKVARSEESSHHDEDITKGGQVNNIRGQNWTGDKSKNESDEMEGKEICNAACGTTGLEKYEIRGGDALAVNLQTEPEDLIVTVVACIHGDSSGAIDINRCKLDQDDQDEDRDGGDLRAQLDAERINLSTYKGNVEGTRTVDQVNPDSTHKVTSGTLLVISDLGALSKETSSQDAEWEAHGQHSRALSDVSMNSDGSSTILDLVKDQSHVHLTKCIHRFRQNNSFGLWPAGKWQCSNCSAILVARLHDLEFMLSQAKPSS